VTQFKGTQNELSVSFSNPGTKNTEMFSVPKDCVVTGAQVDVEGESGITPLTNLHDYKDTVNNRAWNDSDTSNPPTSGPSGLKARSFTATDYTNLSALDSTRMVTYSEISSGERANQMYRFLVNENNITQIEVVWVGMSMTGPFSAGGTATLYIYEESNSTWVLLTNNAGPLFTDATLKKSITKDFGDYLDVDNYLHLLATGPAAPSSPGAHSYVQCDYVSVNVTYNTLIEPQDPEIDLDLDTSPDWSHAGSYIGPSTLGDTEGLTAAIQTQVDASAVDPAPIFFDITLSSQGTLKFSSLLVDYRTNDGPQIGTVPNIIAFEDAGWARSPVNLTDYVTDDFGYENLTITLATDDPSITAGLDLDGRNVNITSALNYFGEAVLNITIKDTGLDLLPSTGDEMTVYKEVTVTVSPTDDPPEILTINQTSPVGSVVETTAYVGFIVDYPIETEDIDGDAVLVTTNGTGNIDSGTGNFTWTPQIEDEGLVSILITATEVNTSISPALTDTAVLNITVINPNRAPALDGIMVNGGSEFSYDNNTPIQINEDEETVLTLVTTDPDGDVLELSTNTSWKWGNFKKSTGNLTLDPDQPEVGLHVFYLTITDGQVEKTYDIPVEVLNINDPPVPEPMYYSGGVKNLTVVVTTDAAFDQEGDELTYNWDFGDQKTGDGLSVMHNYTTEGLYNVSLTVSDGNGGDVLQFVIINVSAPEGQGDDDIIDPNGTEPGPNGTNGNGTSGNGTGPVDDDIEGNVTGEEGSSSLWIVFVIIAVVVLIIIILVVIIVMRRRSKKEEPEPMPQEPVPLDGGQPQPLGQEQYQQPQNYGGQPMGMEGQGMQPEQPLPMGQPPQDFGGQPPVQQDMGYGEQPGPAAEPAPQPFAEPEPVLEPAPGEVPQIQPEAVPPQIPPEADAAAEMAPALQPQVDDQNNY